MFNNEDLDASALGLSPLGYRSLFMGYLLHMYIYIYIYIYIIYIYIYPIKTRLCAELFLTSLYGLAMPTSQECPARSPDTWQPEMGLDPISLGS